MKKKIEYKPQMQN